jgi:hypothetical protein
LSGRYLCDELITRPEESYRLWCVVVCDLENLKNEEAMTCVGSQRHNKKPAGRPDHDQQHCYHYAPTVKPEATTAVVELFMMGVRTPETC